MSDTLGSLFAGIGGFDLGFERAGFKTLWQCEIDKSAQGVLRRHFPHAKLHSDVREVGAHNLEPVDVITFGSPCQDLSVAGKRAGLAGDRSGLFHEAARIIRELRERYGKPDFAIWENVPGAFSSNGGADFAAVVQTLADIGARDICWRVLDSRYFGVAQRRRRVFLVADFGGERAEQILFEPESLRGDIAKGGAKRKGAARGARAGAAGGGGEWPAQLSCTLNTAYGTKMGLEDQHALAGASMFVPAVARTVSDTVTAKWAKGIGGYADVSEHHNLTVYAAPASGDFRPSNIAGTLTAQSGGLGETRNPAFVVENTSAEAFRRLRSTEYCADALASTVSARDYKSATDLVVPFDTTQITSPYNYSSPKAGDPCHPLASGAHPPAVAFEPRYYTRDNKTGGAPTQTPSLSATAWKAGDAAPAVAFQSSQSGVRIADVHATLDSNNGPRRHNGVIQPVAFHPTQDPISSEDGVSNAMSSGNRQGCGTVAVALSPMQAAQSFDRYNSATSPLSPTLPAGEKAGGFNHVMAYSPAMQVRRLTPVECERLQGFPRNWTAEATLPDGTVKAQADGPRYKQLGNAVTVNVAEWIAKRLAATVVDHLPDQSE